MESVWIHGSHMSIVSGIGFEVIEHAVEPHNNGSQGTNNIFLLLVDFCYCQYMK